VPELALELVIMVKLVLLLVLEKRQDLVLERRQDLVLEYELELAQEKCLKVHAGFETSAGESARAGVLERELELVRG
jgi:hypothetical protein